MSVFLLQVKGWSREASEEMKRVIGSSVVDMQVLGEERDTLLVDLKKVSMNTSLSLREHLVFMELARQDMLPLAEKLNVTLS